MSHKNVTERKESVKVLGHFLPKLKSRSWLVTIQEENMKKAGLSEEEYKNPQELAFTFINKWVTSGKGREAGIAICLSENGCYHAHMACYGNVTTLKNVAKILHDAHVEPQVGRKKELRAYLLKEGKYEEKGEKVLYVEGLDCIQDNQGHRSDIDEISDMLESGLTPSQIFEENFRYRKYEKMIQGAFLDKRIKDTPLVKEMHNEFHFGKSGTGKTHVYIQKCEEFSEEEVYLCNDYSNGGFDFYSENPAKVIVLDEFRGGIPYSQLLSMLDVYSRVQQHCRYKNTYALWTQVLICTVLAPEEVYHNMVDNNKNSDTFAQMMRRLDVIVYHYKWKGEYKTFELLPSEYNGKDDMIDRAMKWQQTQDALASTKKASIQNNTDKTDIIESLFGIEDKK